MLALTNGLRSQGYLQILRRPLRSLTAFRQVLGALNGLSESTDVYIHSILKQFDDVKIPTFEHLCVCWQA